MLGYNHSYVNLRRGYNVSFAVIVAFSDYTNIEK